MANLAFPLIGGLISGIGSIFGGSEQANAAEQAAQIQANEEQNALNVQQAEWGQQQQNEAPFLKAGQGAVNQLSQLIPQLNAEGAQYPQFQAPTADQARQTPGYQFAMQQGLQGVQNSAASRGGLLSGNAIAATQQYGQGLADTNYQQVYNNALQGYQQSYNQFQQQQANQFNRYASLAGLGQTTAGQLGQQGQQFAQNVGNISMTGGAQQGQDIQNAAYQNASGYQGAANAVGGALNTVGQYQYLSQLMNAQNQQQQQPGVLADPTDSTQQQGVAV